MRAFNCFRPAARGIAAITLCLGAGVISAQAADLLTTARTAGVIRIANTQSTPPWTMLDDQNQAAGYDVDVARELTKRLGVAKVVFVADSFKNFVEGLRASKYDLVMNDLTPTPERAKQVDFAAPYGVEDFKVFVRSDNADIHGQADLAGKRVGVTTGSSNESWARAHLVKSDIKTYDNGALVFSDLANKRIDEVLTFSALAAPNPRFEAELERGSTDVVAHDVEFHIQIARASGNRYFFDVLSQLGRAVSPRTRLGSTEIADLDRVVHLRSVLAEHRQIYRAIVRQDADDARAAMRMHLSNSRERLRRAHAQI